MTLGRDATAFGEELRRLCLGSAGGGLSGGVDWADQTSDWMGF